MAFHKVDPKKFAFLLAHGTHAGELRKFFVESRVQLLMKGAKIQNMPYGREARVRAISERFPPTTDEILRVWFQKNISLADPLPTEEVLLYLGAYFDEGEPLPDVEAQIICRSALEYLFDDAANVKLIHLLKKSRDPRKSRASTASPSEEANSPLELDEAAMPPVEMNNSVNKGRAENFQLAELLASVISNDEEAIDNALAPFAYSIQLLVEALLRLREGDVVAANEKLKLLADHGPESGLLRSALARASHQRDSSAAPRGIRTLIPKPLDEDLHTDTFEVVGINTNESDTGAIFVKPLFIVSEGYLYQLSDVDRGRLFPESGSVMTFKSVLHRQLRRRELVHWKVSEREGVEGKTRFHLDSELGALIRVIRIQVPSNDVDEVRERIKAYAAEGFWLLGQQVMFVLADGVAVVSPRGANFALDEAFESPWQSWGSLETWLIEGRQYCLEASQGAASYLDLSTLGAAFRKLLKSLDVEQKLSITKAQRNELTTRLRMQSGVEIASRAKRIAASIDQILINEEELDKVLTCLGSQEIVRHRVDELVATEYEKHQAEKAAVKDEISLLKKRKRKLDKECHDIERSIQARVDSISVSVQETFAKAVQEGATTFANAEIFKLLASGSEISPRQVAPVANTGKINSYVKLGAISEADVVARLSMFGINRRQTFVLSSLVGMAEAAGVALILKGGMARQCAQTLLRQDRDDVAIVDVPMGLTSGDFLREMLVNIAKFKGVALLNADLSPIEIYAAELIDSLVEQAMGEMPRSKAVMLSCIGGDFSMQIPIALRRVSLILDLDLNWDRGQQFLEDADTDSLLLLPALLSRLSNIISTMNDDDRRYIEPALVSALHTE